MKLVIVMRNDLNMRKGKMIAQACHGVENMILNHIGGESDVRTKFKDNYNGWVRDHYCKKIVLQANREELLKVISDFKLEDLEVYYGVVLDMGFTEVPPNTLTCAVFGPASDEEIDKITGHLKLL